MDKKTTILVAQIIYPIAALYSILRGLFYLRIPGDLSYKNYWSRFCFRIFYGITLIICIFVQQDFETLFLSIVDSFVALLVLCSYFFLIKSIQDFSTFSSIAGVWIQKIWPYLFIVTLLLMITVDIYIFVGPYRNDKIVFGYVRTAYALLNTLLMITFICFPLLYFLIKIKSAQKHSRNRFFIALVLTSIISAIILSLNAYESFELTKIDFDYSRKPPLFIIFQLIIDIIYIFIQDIIDWLLQWLLCEESGPVDFSAILNNDSSYH